MYRNEWTVYICVFPSWVASNLSLLFIITQNLIANFDHIIQQTEPLTDFFRVRRLLGITVRVSKVVLLTSALMDSEELIYFCLESENKNENSLLF